MNEYHSVHPEKNPVALAISELSADQLQYVLSQYTIFPRNIVSFLTSVRDISRNAGFSEVANELTRNIGEELGTETNGVSHYDMLIRGLAEGVYPADPTLETYLRTLKPSEATRAFIDRTRKITEDQRAAYAIGGAYALESSAVPELVIVQNLVNELFTRVTGQPMQGGLLKEFFRRHLETWEPGHEQGLRETTAKYITSTEDHKLLEVGFRDIIITMDTWWTGLYKETRNL